MTTTVEQVIAKKGSQYYKIDVGASVLRASEELLERNVGALLVFDGGSLVGIVSERDCVRRVIAKRRDPETTLVRDVMTPRPVSVSPEESIERCMSTMTHGRFRHLPVMQGSRVVGVVTLGDAVHAVLGEKQHVIEDLESYIHGSPASVRPPAP